ncbi:hypothetical protein EYB26_009466 [Talaromyces marneffei]|uniref:uncharacterized protein n=1 Tax=Talaromyces marneffei TaxID=37727 RepID=UPI0012A94935|nr:uncharacterized protein EYB26_009466 [Talaromyces marneffei]QGA21755.1 hypothetical protein EYB26_009466 [Talaromyces marneffei]
MAGLDVAGVVGTWVAAGIALIALVGIVSPIPRVRAPRINKARKFDGEEWKSFDSKRLAIGDIKSIDTPASWVTFGAFLGGHSVEFEKDADIIVNEGAAFIPVSKAFLMTFALVGRFSDEQDRRRKLKGDGVRMWDRRASSLKPRDIELGNLRGQALPRVRSRPDIQIHGLTGSLYFISPGHSISGDRVKDSWSVIFVGESMLKPLEIPKDSISLETMGMLSLGFLPFKDRCFVNVLDPLDEDDNDSANSSVNSDEDVQTARGFRRRLSRKTAEDDDPDNIILPRTLVRTKNFINKDDSPISVIAYELQEIIVTEAEFLEWFSSQEDAKYLALYEMKLDVQTRQELRELADQTYVPAAAHWVRLKNALASYNSPRVEYFIRREDAQRIAYSLLDLSWHPEGYLIPGAAKENERASMMDLLCSISERTRPFVIRLKEGVSALELSSRDEKAFLDATEPVIRRAVSSPTRRALLQPLFAFDEFLRKLQHDRAEVQQMVGILMLTNAEFAELVYQSARHMTSLSQARVEIDLRTGVLTVPSAFGTVQTFEIDVHILYRASLQLGSQEKISVKHSDILKAALHAYLRSLMLTSCYDAEPLIACFETMKSDIFYMA